MMARGAVQLRDYTESGLRDPAVLAIADRIFYRDDGVPVTQRGGSSAAVLPGVEIRTKDGRTLWRKVESLPGDAENPVDWPAIEAKFRDCVSFSAKPVAASSIDGAIAAVKELEKLPDATEIIRLLN
jgi:2-methylcitrate dehydratase PrpD